MTFARAHASSHAAADREAHDHAPGAPCHVCGPERVHGNAVVAALGGEERLATAVTRGIGAGRPLDPATRATMEGRFGRDLGNVRVHDDDAAARSADALDAHGYSVGPDVVLGASARPDTLLHELTHVVQRGEGAGDAHTTAAAEREADAIAAGARATVRERLAPAVVARQAKRPGDHLTQAEIIAAWNASKGNVLEFKQRLFGGVAREEFMTDEYLATFLLRKGFTPEGPGPAVEPYTGPAIGPAPKDEEERDIFIAHPDGGNIRKRIRGTKAGLDALQNAASEHSFYQMLPGLIAGLGGIKPGSATRAIAPASFRGSNPPPARIVAAPPVATPAPPPAATTAPPAPPRPTGKQPPTPVPPPKPAPKPAPWATPSAPPKKTEPRGGVTPTTGGTPPQPAPPAGGTAYNRAEMEVARTRWRNLRDDTLRRDPTCAFCQARPSVTGDHVEPLVDAQATVDVGMLTADQAREGANNPMNVRGICQQCNSSKSGRPAGDPVLDPRYWRPSNPDQALVEHMRMMERWPN